MFPEDNLLKLINSSSIKSVAIKVSINIHMQHLEAARDIQVCNDNVKVWIIFKVKHLNALFLFSFTV